VSPKAEHRQGRAAETIVDVPESASISSASVGCVAEAGTQMPELEDIVTFSVVADAGGVSPAARRLGVSKSIVSRRLLRLETELGVQLLARTTRGAALTEAGMTFREHAARISAEMDAAREELAPAGDLRGRLRIAAPLSFGPTLVAPVLAELARRHPLLQVHAAYGDRFVDLAAEGFDAAIRVGYLGDSNLVARRLGPISGKVVASPSYIAQHGAPRTPEELLGHQALMQGTEAWRFIDGDNMISVRPQGRFKADNGTALLVAAVAGVGIAYLPDSLTSEHITSGALVAVMPRYPVPDGGLFLVRPPGPKPSRKLRVLTDLLIERCG
jgi:DNA-binding transcriptional LysR family regulator